MDRQLIYPGQIPLETDLLGTNKNAMIALSKLSSAVLGTATQLNGLACVPNIPAALNVVVGQGEIYSLQNIDGAAYSSIAADTTHTILKQGILLDPVTLSCPAPATAGFSINYLVQAAYTDADAIPVVLPYYNANNPSQAYSGPANAGTTNNTVRKGVCTVSVKVGIAATTGTQITPSADAGYVGLYVVTVANGQASVLNTNISTYAGAPFITEALTQKISQATADARYTAQTALAASTGASLVHTIALGIGAVDRTLEETGRDWLWLQGYLPAGYVTDGSVDYGAYIYKAIQAAQAQKKKLRLPGGTFGFTDAAGAGAGLGLYIGSTPLTIVGAGIDVTILKNLSATGRGININTAYVNCMGFTIDNNGGSGQALTVSGILCKIGLIKIINQADVSNYALDISNATLSQFEHMDVEAVNCVSMYNTGYTILRHVFTIPNGGRALHMNVCSACTLYDFSINNSTATAAGLAQLTYLEIIGCRNTTFFSPTFEFGETNFISIAYFDIEGSSTTAFNNGYLSHEGTATKKFVQLTTTPSQNVVFDGFEVRTTQSGMTFLDTAIAGCSGIVVKNIYTNNSSAMVGVSNTALCASLSVENWNDVTANSTWTALNATVFNTKSVTGLANNIILTVDAASAVALTTGVTSNIASIVLTPGTWIVEGSVLYRPAAATTTIYIRGGIGLASATLPAINPGISAAITTTVDTSVAMIPLRVVVTTTTTTVYLTLAAVFATSTAAAYGVLQAQRVIN